MVIMLAPSCSDGSRVHRAMIADVVLMAAVILAVGTGRQPDARASDNDQPKIEPEIKLTNVDLSTDPKQGTATIRFHVDEPAGTRFYVSYNHQGVRGAAGTNYIWEIARDGGADV